MEEVDKEHEEKMRDIRKMAIFNAATGLNNRWAYMIIIGCMINITAGLQMISDLDVNSKFVAYELGMANLLMWWSLNKYLRFSKEYSSLPRVFLSSSYAVFTGLAGVLPLIIGVCIFSTIMLYTNFHFRDTITTVFTFFFMMQGDTYFDTGTNMAQVNVLFSLFFYFVWANFFGIFVIMNVTLAQVEDGYMNQKNL